MAASTLCGVIAVNRPEICPFCHHSAEFWRTSVQMRSWKMYCSHCKVGVEISDHALTTTCKNASASLRYIREQLRHGDRVKVDVTDMHREI